MDDLRFSFSGHHPLMKLVEQLREERDAAIARAEAAEAILARIAEMITPPQAPPAVDVYKTVAELIDYYEDLTCGQSREIIALRARVAELEAELAAFRAAEEWLAVSDPPAKNGPHLRWNGKSLLIRHHRPGLMKLIVIYPPAPDGDAATE